MLTIDFIKAVRAEDPTLADNLREDMAHDLLGATQGTYPGLRWYHYCAAICMRHKDDNAGLEAILTTYQGM